MGVFDLDKEAVVHRCTQVIRQSGNSRVLKQAAEWYIDMKYFTQSLENLCRLQ